MKQHSIFHRVSMAALSAMIAAGSALADNNPGADGTMVIPGKCLHLSIGKTNFTADCKGQIANVNGGGDVSFMFSLRTGGIVGFQGNGRKVTGNKTTARLPLTFVNIGSGVGQLLGVDRASGACTFTDPFAGPPPYLAPLKRSSSDWFLRGFALAARHIERAIFIAIHGASSSS